MIMTSLAGILEENRLELIISSLTCIEYIICSLICIHKRHLNLKCFVIFSEVLNYLWICAGLECHLSGYIHSFLHNHGSGGSSS